MNKEQLKGAVRMLEAILEIAAEEGDEAVPVTAIEELLEKYKSRLAKLP